MILKFLILLLSPLLFYSFLSCNQAAHQSGDLKKVDTVKNDKTSFRPVNKQTDNLPNSNLEEKIIDTIFKLAEVKERAKYIEQQTKGKRHLIIWVENTPGSDNQYYWIKVGEDNGMNFVTHFNFYVYPDSMRIMYFDINNDKEIGLAEWRRIAN